MRLLKVLLGAALALPLMVAAALAQQPLKIRIAWTVPVANSPTILYEMPENLKFKGKSYDIELIYFQGTPLMITALQANEVDIALLAYSSLALAIQNAGMEDLRVIADEAQEGVDGYYTSPFMVRKDSGIDKVEDVKGKVVATVGAGSAVDIAMRAMLKKARPRRQARLHDGRSARSRTCARCWPTRRPTWSRRCCRSRSIRRLVEIGKTLFTVKDAIGRSQFIVWVAREGFLQKNKAAMTDFMEDSITLAALPDGPEEPRQADGDRSARRQASGRGLFGLDVHQQGSLSRSGPDPGYRRAADARSTSSSRSASSRTRWTSRNTPI